MDKLQLIGLMCVFLFYYFSFAQRAYMQMQTILKLNWCAFVSVQRSINDNNTRHTIHRWVSKKNFDRTLDSSRCDGWGGSWWLAVQFVIDMNQHNFYTHSMVWFGQGCSARAVGECKQKLMHVHVVIGWQELTSVSSHRGQLLNANDTDEPLRVVCVCFFVVLLRLTSFRSHNGLSKVFSPVSNHEVTNFLTLLSFPAPQQQKKMEERHRTYLSNGIPMDGKKEKKKNETW